MSQKKKRVRYELDANGIETLSDEEIKIILRGADPLIMSGGRSMLTKILAGSKEKKILELHLDDSPVYGSFRGITQKEILAKIDWMILHDYLAIEYDYRLPVLVFTDKGWEIERETYANELLEQLRGAAEGQRYEFVETLTERDRGMILLLLDKMAASGDKNFIPILMAWKMIECKKLKARIQEVIDQLEKSEHVQQKNSEMEVISFVANKRWLSIPVDTRRELERNVWCSSCCNVVQIVKYQVKEDRGIIELHGKCKTCGHDVVRVLD